MPRSILLGRPMPQPGEPLFTDEDTAYAMALAEEEADTCQKCGMLKIICRDPAYQFGFDTEVETCWATHRVAEKQATFADAHDSTRAALVIAPRYMEGREPPVDVGLGLAESSEEGDHGGDDPQDQQAHEH